MMYLDFQNLNPIISVVYAQGKNSVVATGGGGEWLCPLILGYSKSFVLFGAPGNDKTTNYSIKKFRFLMQNNVQFDIILV